MYAFHLHSSKSDGESTPEEIINKAAEKGLKYVAIADHHYNQTSDVFEYAKSKGIKLIPAVEINCSELSGLHIGAYGIKFDNYLNAVFQYLFNTNNEIYKKIILNLKNEGFPIDEAKIIKDYGMINRLTIKQHMVKEGFVSSTAEATKHTGRSSKNYYPNIDLNAESVIKLIKACGGTSVLFHPGDIKNPKNGLQVLDNESLKNLVSKLKSFGLDGIEIINHKAKRNMPEFFVDLANEFDLLKVNGSDYHNQTHQFETSAEFVDFERFIDEVEKNSEKSSIKNIKKFQKEILNSLRQKENKTFSEKKIADREIE